MMKITQTILGILLFFNCLSAQNESILTLAEEMPYFAGCQDITNDADKKRQCSNTKLVRFISQNLEYPIEAYTAEIEGTVYVSFIVDENGQVIQPTILMDIGGGCGEAALAVLNKMPHWEAGIQNDKKVKVKLNLPIQFSLKKEESTIANGYNITWGYLKGTTISQETLQQNINDGVNVRDIHGNDALVKEITFIFEKKNRSIQAKSREGVSTDLKKIAKKAKAGGVFTIVVNIQEKGKFVVAKRSFQVVK
jgi:TonB family protein